ncbi:MAG TPA: glucosidase, partial [Planctomycetota bacterium]|nr:glucosidase [Planctomycetota bacterium]
MHPEDRRLDEARERRAHWYRWGPYLAERAWGTVREDYSVDGAAWSYFPHDHARSRAYRWNEDGLLGFCDNHQRLCFALALWNGRDPILKERLFGVAGPEGNHGEDVKEVYFFQEALPTAAWARATYRYPRREYPYARLLEENARRGRDADEFELWDAGAFDDGWFDVSASYAKASPDDLLIEIAATNHGPAGTLHVLPTLWFRNRWSFEPGAPRPELRREPRDDGVAAVLATHPQTDAFRWFAEGADDVLFTDNDTNVARLWGAPNPSPWTKDAFHRRVVNGEVGATRPDGRGTKAAAVYRLDLDAGATRRLRLRLRLAGDRSEPFGPGFDAVLAERRAEHDTFYDRLAPERVSDDARRVQRQALAGMVWSKQFFHYDVRKWLSGDPGMPPPESRRAGRNARWTHLHNEDVLLMPDTWEYPWYAAWDLAFHCIPYALIDSDFAKRQLILLLREWYMHPNGQIPAYEWAFDDVNPPVHAWAAWRVYKIEKRARGVGDVHFLRRVFHKLLLNFNWWVNRKDVEGHNVFEGGFLGLDNIGVFDRSMKLPPGVRLRQSDATAWMGMFCLNMLAIALELAHDDPSYEDVASKFFEHFVYIASAMNRLGGATDLWDEEDGFYYDALTFDDGRSRPLKVRSMVGLTPLFAVETVEPDLLERLPGFARRMRWFLREREDLRDHIDSS